MTDRSQWLLQQNTAQLKSIIVTDARNQSPGWNLSVEMGPFINKVTQQPLEQHPDDAGTAMIQMIMRNNVTTNTQLSYRIRDIHQVVPVTSAPPATKPVRIRSTSLPRLPGLPLSACHTSCRYLHRTVDLDAGDNANRINLPKKALIFLHLEGYQRLLSSTGRVQPLQLNPITTQAMLFRMPLPPPLRY